MCEGLSLEEALAENAATIRKYGFMVCGVVNAPGESGRLPEWAYTVGLLDASDHPELVVVGPAFDHTGPLLQAIGNAVLDGDRFDVGDRVSISGATLHFGLVHPVQYGLTTFNTWHNLVATGDLECDELEVLQVFVPSTWFCAHHRDAQPDLSLPHARIDAPIHVPNRAARRAEQRRRGRRG